uniref:Uncharacterized protein n=1 Tax=Quercus lobata TaxID=97700 RepID=A0A7N2LX56_QUELO
MRDVRFSKCLFFGGSLLNCQFGKQACLEVSRRSEKYLYDMKSSLLMAIGKMKEGAYFNLKRPYNSVTMHKTYKEKQYYQRNYGHRGKELIELGSGDFDSSKEEKDAEHKYSHVIINSASSSSSGSKFTGHEVSLPASLSPFIRSLQKMSPKTEAHPNALKNINKDYTLLQASVKGIINPMKDINCLNVAGLFLHWIFEILTRKGYRNSIDSTKSIQE